MAWLPKTKVRNHFKVLVFLLGFGKHELQARAKNEMEV